jgi:quercetin dioxygenase-like cupin family protein
MIIQHSKDVKSEKIREEGVEGVHKQRLLTPEMGAPNFTMRKFTVEEGGFTFYHEHDFEHEVYILKGAGVARQEDDEIEIQAGDALLILPGEIHQFVNRGKGDFVFLCLIPNDAKM